MSGDAQPNSKQRATEARPPPSPPLIKEKAAIGALCVVCGDRACSHLYYGVAACHGCKCFFWRTVKSRLNYVCRYGGTCSISTAGRNACRYCRFNRCLSVGMKMEAVKMDRKVTKRKREKMSEGDEVDEGGVENYENTVDAKRAKSDNRLLISSLLLIDKTSSDGNAKLSSLHFVQPSLTNLLDEPELLDGFRSEMCYRATRLADEQLCYDTERRLVTWAIDWCRQTAEIGDVHHTTDKIALLRACCASLALLELGWHSSSQSDAQIPLSNNSFLLTHAVPPSNSFLNWKTVQSLSKWTQRELKPLCLKAKEIVLLKALIVLNPDAHGLSSDAESSIRMLRERVHTALFQLLTENCEPIAAASRLAHILLLIPQLALMGVDVIEQVRVRNTFKKRSADGDGLLFWQLYGDIFDDVHTDDYLEHSASCTKWRRPETAISPFKTTSSQQLQQHVLLQLPANNNTTNIIIMNKKKEKTLLNTNFEMDDHKDDLFDLGRHEYDEYHRFMTGSEVQMQTDSSRMFASDVSFLPSFSMHFDPFPSSESLFSSHFSRSVVPNHFG
ncbi:unnamed protein product [Caenorhabditis sp. 36 PRJEB53466]|nr:unnamed protein product [Caenorhabditis sp. 36 PRJEB53466]